jgi:hypothetical protein
VHITQCNCGDSCRARTFRSLCCSARTIPEFFITIQELKYLTTIISKTTNRRALCSPYYLLYLTLGTRALLCIRTKKPRSFRSPLFSLHSLHHFHLSNELDPYEATRSSASCSAKISWFDNIQVVPSQARSWVCHRY